MAIKETVTIQTVNHPTTINQLHERYALFFWNVLNVQVTHVRDSHLEFKDYGEIIGVTNVTSNVEYATITYERDKLMPHYDELVIAENELREYEAALSNKQSRLRGIDTDLNLKWWFLQFFFGMSVVIGVLTFAFEISGIKAQTVYIGIIAFILLMFGKLAYNIVRKRKAEKLWSECYDEIKELTPLVELAKNNAITLNKRIMNEFRNAQ